MNGGWHDAGDLSQGLVNTGEAKYAMFSLAAEARASRTHPAWLPALEDEALWGLDWIHKARFPGGFRVGFASMNIWTDGIIGNEDDRTAAALNNPNVNLNLPPKPNRAVHSRIPLPTSCSGKTDSCRPPIPVVFAVTPKRPDPVAAARPSPAPSSAKAVHRNSRAA